MSKKGDDYLPPRRKGTKPIQCEWCELGATHRIAADKGYRRYSCDAHYEKTRRLVMLDGRGDDPVVLVIQSQPFTIEVLE